jgi:hypothetical protein
MATSRSTCVNVLKAKGRGVAAFSALTHPTRARAAHAGTLGRAVPSAAVAVKALRFAPPAARRAQPSHTSKDRSCGNPGPRAALTDACAAGGSQR